MPECRECGANVALDENFCGNCGAQNPPTSVELKTVSATVDQVELLMAEAEPKPVEEPEKLDSAPLEEPKKLDSAPIEDVPTEETPVETPRVKPTTLAENTGEPIA